MATQEAIYKRNLESSILFMQQEHAATLKALHEEIQNLQKKCKDLTFELNMAGLDLGRTENPDTQEHIKHLTNMIDTQRETQHELEVELEKKDKLIKENEYTYKRQKMKHIEELKAKNRELNQLQAELEAAANTNAYLQNELLKHKKERYLANQAAGHPKAPENHAPAPPKESRVNPKRAFHIRRTLGEPFVSLSDDGTELKPVVRPSSGNRARGHSGSTSRSESPPELAKPFLRGQETEEKITEKKQPPLPPIRTSSGRVVFQDQVDVVHLSVHSVPAPRVTHKPGPPQAQQLETLAIDQVSSSNPAWRHRPKESHSSEFR